MNANSVAMTSPSVQIPDAYRRWGVLAMTSTLVVLTLLGGIHLFYQQQSALPVVRSVLAQELAAPDLESINPAEWQPLRLPDKICSAECRSQFKIYRAMVDVPTGYSLAVYLPMFDGAAAVWVNDRSIGVSGSMQDPIADMTYQPTLYRVPGDLVIAGPNVIDVVVSAQVPSGGRLIPFHVAPLSELEPAHATASFLTVGVLTAFNGIFLVLGFCALLLYVSGDRDRLYLWFVLLLVFSATRNLNVLWPEWPANLAIRNWMYLASTLGVLLTVSGLVSRFAQRTETRLDIGLVLFWIPASLLIAIGLFVDLAASWFYANTAIRVIGIVLVPYALVRFLLHARSLSIAVHNVIFALLLIGLVLVLHDIVQTWPPRRLIFPLSNLAGLPIVLSFCVILVSRYAGHLAAIQAHNRELRDAVAARENELAESHRRESEQARLQVLGDERQRIMRDMHDGVAGRLAVLIQKLRRGPPASDTLTDELQHSLQDLRLVIGSLDEELGADFRAALAAFHEQIAPIVEDDGVILRWWDTLAESPALGPQRTLQVYRCLQEAIHNVLRHADANTLDVHIHSFNDGIELIVADDGVGIDSTASPGRGMRNMRNRLESLGGALLVESDQGGTRIRMQIPT
ncbi:MAG: ATP-binding protein [Pseudomonadota bacterium]